MYKEYIATHTCIQTETTCTYNVLHVYSLQYTLYMDAHTITNILTWQKVDKHNPRSKQTLAHMYTTKENTPSVADR